MIWRILDTLMSVFRVVFWAGLIVCLALYRMFGDEPVVLILIVLCCIGNIACSVDHFMNRR